MQLKIGAKNMSYEMSNSRELYDLCRKYRFYYQQKKGLEELDKKFWSKDIHKAYNKSVDNLNMIIDRMIELVISEFIRPFNVQIQHVNRPRTDKHGTLPQIRIDSEDSVVINDKEFCDIVERVMRQKNIGLQYNRVLV